MVWVSLTFTPHRLLQIADLGKGLVLPAGAEEVAELVEDDAADTTSVKERERLLVVGGSLRVVVVSGHVGCFSGAAG